MNNSKASPQNLTLLAEFEKNVEAVIGILENSANTIDQWIKDLPNSARTGGRFIPQRTIGIVISMLHSFNPFADFLPEIQRFIITYAPKFEDRVEKQYSGINNKIQEIVGKCSQTPLSPPANPAIPFVEMTELKRYIEKLVEDLRFCVKKAREDFKPAAAEQVGVVDKLVKDFWSSNRESLKQEEAVISQDLMKRKMSSTTLLARDLIGINKKYLQKLVEEVIGCLEKDYSHLSPKKFKHPVLKAVETEYLNLGSKVGGWLQASQQLSHYDQFQKAVTAYMTEAKKDVENKFDLWAERFNRKKGWWCDPKWISIIVIILIAVIGWWRFDSTSESIKSSTSEKFSPSIVAGPNSKIDVSYSGISPDEPKEPEYVDLDESRLVVYNRKNNVLWTENFVGDVMTGVVIDIVGDRVKEVIVGIGGESEDAGRVIAFDASGKELWSYLPKSRKYYSGGSSNKLTVQTLMVANLCNDREKKIIVLYRDAHGWYQSRLVLLDASGKKTGSYWHPGHLSKVVLGSEDGGYPLKILVGGLNNDISGSFDETGYIYGIFLLDPTNIQGEAPPYYGQMRIGHQEWYGIILPRGESVHRLEIIDHDNDNKNEICAWTNKGHIFYLNFSGQIIGLGQSDGAVGEAQFKLIK